MADQIGSLEVGKKADLVLLDFARPHLYPRHSVSSAIVYQANGSEVDTVVVDGRVLVAAGELTGMGPDGAALPARAAGVRPGGAAGAPGGLSQPVLHATFMM